MNVSDIFFKNDTLLHSLLLAVSICEFFKEKSKLTKSNQ